MVSNSSVKASKDSSTVSGLPPLAEVARKLVATEGEHQKSFGKGQVESGDLVNSFGKSYLASLDEAIRRHVHVSYKYYIQVLSRHLPIGSSHRGQEWKFVVRSTKPKMEHTQDVWSYDNKTSTLTLEWSLPHIFEMKNFLRARSTYDPKIIKDIEAYLRLTGVNLDELEGEKVYRG